MFIVYFGWYTNVQNSPGIVNQIWAIHCNLADLKWVSSNTPLVFHTVAPVRMVTMVISASTTSMTASRRLVTMFASTAARVRTLFKTTIAYAPITSQVCVYHLYLFCQWRLPLVEYTVNRCDLSASTLLSIWHVLASIYGFMYKFCTILCRWFRFLIH